MSISETNQLKSYSSFNEVLNYRAKNNKNDDAYHFVIKYPENIEKITYSELLADVKDIASQVHDSNKVLGARVLICLSPGLNYMKSFYSSLYSGKAAVPVHPPANEKDLNKEKIRNIIKDCSPEIVITEKKIIDQFPDLFEGITNILIIEDLASNKACGKDFKEISNELALLQYTSGTTGLPKGVKIKHSNLINNTFYQGVIYKQKYEKIVCVNWLPPYHDMGLIGLLLAPLFNGVLSINMASFSFLYSPITWLKLISDQKYPVATGAPNFALDYTVDRLTPEKLERMKDKLDLSKLALLYCGAEFIHQETLQKFHDLFSPYGFNWNAMIPCYGMAEATLLATQRMFHQEISFDKPKQSNHGIVKNTTGCGEIIPEHKLQIFDHQNKKLKDGEIGRICLSGPSITDGYWNHDPTFIQYNQYKFLDTGDIGYLKNGQLYPLGREKELIIIDGKNIYPTDIENFLRLQLKDLVTKRLCVISSLIEQKEEIIIIIEDTDLTDEIEFKINQLLLSSLGIQAKEIFAVKRNSLPRTTSGKLQRPKTRQFYQDGTLERLIKATSPAAKNQKEVFIHLTLEKVKEILEGKEDVEKITKHTDFSDINIDSLKATELLGEIQQISQKKIQVDIIFNHSSVQRLADYLF